MSYDNDFEYFEQHDTPNQISVSVAIAAAIGDLPEHFIRSRDVKFTRASKQRVANRLERGQRVTTSDVENAFVKNDSSGTIMTRVALEGGWRDKRYNIALVVNITEFNGNAPISKTTRTIMGWVREDPHPVHGLPDEAVININTVVTRDMVENGSMYGTVRNTSKLTGKSSDELIISDKKVLIGDNISNKIKFESDYLNSQSGGGFTSSIISDEYSTDTKVNDLASDSGTILTAAINDALFDDSSAPINSNSKDVDEFIILLNSQTNNQLGQQIGLKSFTWGAFKRAVGWEKYNKLEVFDTPAAPIFNTAHTHGSMESIEHDTYDISINDIGFPLVHSICTIIEKYGLALLNLTFNWVSGAEPLVYSTIVRPLDNSELYPAVIDRIEHEARVAFERFTTIVGIQTIEVIFDGGFGKASGISIRVNGDPTPIPLVVSPAQTSLYSEAVVGQNDDRLSNATVLAINNIMKAHGTSTGGYTLNEPLQAPILADTRTAIPQQNNEPTLGAPTGSNRVWY